MAAPVVEEVKPHMPNPRQGEHVFGVAHIFASFNDTFVVRIPSPRRTPARPGAFPASKP